MRDHPNLRRMAAQAMSFASAGIKSGWRLVSVSFNATKPGIAEQGAEQAKIFQRVVEIGLPHGVLAGLLEIGVRRMKR